MNLREDGDWRRVSSGLGIYRLGVIAQLVLTCIAMGAVGVVLVSKNPASMEGLGLVLPVAGLVATLVMIIGLERYVSHLPPQVGARLAAIGAIVLMIVSGLIQIYAYWFLWRLRAAQDASSSSDWARLGDMLDLAEALPWIEMAAGLAAMGALLLVLWSLHTVGRWLGDRWIERRAASLAIAAALLALFSGGLRWWLATADDPSVTVVVVLGIAALLWALATIVLYVELLREVAEVVAYRAPEPRLPD
jgi:hypothetical protein